MGIPLNNAIDMRQVASPASPSSGTTSLYVKSDDKVYTKSTSGVESVLGTVSIQSITSSATPTPTGDGVDNQLYITALGVAATIAVPSGTPANGNTVLLRIKDDGTARTIAWNAIYKWYVTKPITTIAGKHFYVSARYNSANTTWDVLAYLPEQ